MSAGEGSKISQRMLDQLCPNCGGDALWETERQTGEYLTVEGPTQRLSIPVTASYRECQGCGWKGEA